MQIAEVFYIYPVKLLAVDDFPVYSHVIDLVTYADAINAIIIEVSNDFWLILLCINRKN